MNPTPVTLAILSLAVATAAAAEDFELPPLGDIGIDGSLFPPAGDPEDVEIDEVGELPEVWDDAPRAPSYDLLPGVNGLYLQPLIAVPLDRFEFQRKTPSVIAEEMLQDAIRERLGNKQVIDSFDLEEARLAVTQMYAKQGFVNSGAILPDQEIADGVVTLKVIEGRLSEIHVGGNKSLSDDFFESRLMQNISVPLNINDLKGPLARLHQNPNIRKINAELRPGLVPGESYLQLDVDERSPLRGGIDFHNERPPGVGEEQLEFWMTHTSLTKHGDILDFRYGVFDSGIEDPEVTPFKNLQVSYSLPINSNDTTLHAMFARQSYLLIQEPFLDLDIEGETALARIGIRHPIWRFHGAEPGGAEGEIRVSELALGLYFDRSNSETSLLGSPFNVTSGSIDGEIDLSTIRFTQEFSTRDMDEALALRSTFSLGIDAFGTTDDGTDRDASYFSWLGQAHYVRRLGASGAEMVLRGSLQFADGPLLSLEQFGIGGVHSVRGYAENQLVRDMGYQGSMEFHYPVLRGKDDRKMLTLVPFVDVGGGWNSESTTPFGTTATNHETIVSAGIGLLYRPTKNITAEVYWGHAFTDFPNSGDGGLQDQGIHFRLSAGSF